MKTFLTVGVDKSGGRKVLLGPDVDYRKHKDLFSLAKAGDLPEGCVAVERYTIDRRAEPLEKKFSAERENGLVVGLDGKNCSQVELDRQRFEVAERHRESACRSSGVKFKKRKFVPNADPVEAEEEAPAQAETPPPSTETAPPQDQKAEDQKEQGNLFE